MLIVLLLYMGEKPLLFPIIFFLSLSTISTVVFLLFFPKQILGNISVSAEGVQAKCFSVHYFTAKWDEIKHVGIYQIPGRFGIPIHCMFLSKTPVEMKNLKRRHLDILQRQSLAIYFQVKPNAEEELKKHVSPDRIFHYGLLSIHS